MTLEYWLLCFLPSRSMVSGSSDDVSIATSGGHDKHPSRRSHANQDLVDGSLDLVEDKVQTQLFILECTIVVFCIDWYLGTNSACINQQKGWCLRLCDLFESPWWCFIFRCLIWAPTLVMGMGMQVIITWVPKKRSFANWSSTFYSPSCGEEGPAFQVYRHFNSIVFGIL